MVASDNGEPGRALLVDAVLSEADVNSNLRRLLHSGLAHLKVSVNLRYPSTIDVKIVGFLVSARCVTIPKRPSLMSETGVNRGISWKKKNHWPERGRCQEAIGGINFTKSEMLKFYNLVWNLTFETPAWQRYLQMLLLTEWCVVWGWWLAFLKWRVKTYLIEVMSPARLPTPQLFSVFTFIVYDRTR
jgi:hypothetical protein